MSTTPEELIADIVERAGSQYWGKYRATVENPDDSEKLGRITVKCPAVYGDVESPWAWPVAPFAGPGYGWFMLPKQGDGVWLEFEGGSASRPLWTGFWYSRDDVPSPGDVDVRVLVSTEGMKLVLDDSAKKLQLLHPGGAELTMTDNDITLKIGSAKIVLSSSGVAINDTAFQVS